jgi:ABC-type uncharacterized transport system involved in gliding motility auxiliary subunit
MAKIFSVLWWLGTALVFGAAGIRFGMPAQDQYAFYLAWAGIACWVLYAASQWREIAGTFSGRQARYGTLAGTSVLIVLGILVAVNYIGKQQNKRWDLTANKQFSLSDQSRNVLAKLDGPLQIMVFAEETAVQGLRDRMNEYEYASSQVTTEYIDPDRQRAIAQQNGVQQYGTIVVNYKGRSERTTASTEQDITNTIIKAVSGQQRKVYFTSGHGEKNITSAERDGYATIVEALKQENYGVETLVLAQTGSVPDDAAVVIVAGPQTDFFAPEVDALRAYLGKAGKVLLALDPPSKVGAPDTTSLVALAKEWNIEVGSDIVVDASGMGRLIGTDASVPVAAAYPAHPITDRFSILTAYPLARSAVPATGGAEGRTAQAFIESGPRSWAEADVKALLTSGEVTMDPAKGDKPGPVGMGAAATAAITTEAPKPDATTPDDAPKPEARFVVIGDSDFASNGVLGIQGNRDIFMNTVGWLSQQENLIAIRPTQAGDSRITLTSTQQTNITWLSLLLIPGAVFATGFYSWWRRR